MLYGMAAIFDFNLRRPFSEPHKKKELLANWNSTHLIASRVKETLGATSNTILLDACCKVLNFSKQLNKLTFGVVFCLQFSLNYHVGCCWTYNSLLRFSSVRQFWTSQFRAVDSRQMVSSAVPVKLLLLCFSDVGSLSYSPTYLMHVFNMWRRIYS